MKTLLPSHKKAIEKAIDISFQKTLDNLPLAKIDTNPLSCDSRLLPHLANSFAVSIANLSEAESRKFIATALEIHRYKGTLHAVKTALKSVFVDAKIIELPNFLFKIELAVSEGEIVDSKSYYKAVFLINQSKNLRSHLLGTEVVFPQAKAMINRGDSAILGISGEVKREIRLNARIYRNAKAVFAI